MKQIILIISIGIYSLVGVNTFAQVATAANPALTPGTEEVVAENKKDCKKNCKKACCKKASRFSQANLKACCAGKSKKSCCAKKAEGKKENEL